MKGRETGENENGRRGSTSVREKSGQKINLRPMTFSSRKRILERRGKWEERREKIKRRERMSEREEERRRIKTRRSKEKAFVEIAVKRSNDPSPFEHFVLEK